MSLEDSKKIINGSYDLNRKWKICFEYHRDYEKYPLSKEEFNQIHDEMIAVLEKHHMNWKVD